MRKKIGYIITGILCFIVGAGLVCAGVYFFPKEVVKTITEKNVTISDTGISESVEKVADSVVVIETYQEGELVGTGSGFVYDTDDKYGYILTNHHVINTEDILITYSDSSTTEAEVVGSDEYSDIAVLKVSKDTILGVATMGNSKDVKVGDTVFAIGSPMGKEFKNTVTKGILSGKDRLISVSVSNYDADYILNVMQTDAAINPGNSGGPLCNINGEVIGVNSLKIVDENVEGMGFAIPIEIVMGLTDRLEKREAIVRPYLGVTMTEITDEWNLYREGIKIDDEVENGVVITSVEDGSPADIAGLKKGDVIASVDNVKVKSSAHFRYLLYKYDVGDTITVKCYRDSKFKEIKIKLTKSLNEA